MSTHATGRFVNAVRTPMTMIGHMDLHGNPNGLDAWTPLGALTDSITPSALHCVSFHGNDAPDIDSREHRLLINGMVERPLVFTMDELMRLPAVSRIHYIECIANVPHPRGKTLEEMHGMVGCSKWTGVPLSLLLDEVGVRAGGNWILAEGAEATKVGASLPMGKAMDIEAPARRIALTCFTFPWTWNGQEAVLQSRCTDDEERVILLPVVRFPPA